MNESQSTRLPPEIIFVPPPDGPGIPAKRLKNIAGASVVGALVGLVLSTAISVPAWVWGLAMVPLFLAVGVSVVLYRRHVNRAYQAQRRRFLERIPNTAGDPRVAELGRAWKEPDRFPKLDDVRAALRTTAGEAQVDRAQIICFGFADVPEVGELHFEPEIITPTGAVWRQLHWLIIAGALAALFVLDTLHLLPAWIPVTRGLFWGFGYFLVAGLVTLAVWVWKGMIRPTYIRMAPGVIQVLQYRYARSKPIIRSYPMEPGTLAVFTLIRTRLVLTLARSENTDVLAFSQMRQPRQRIERAWQALLSTALTPPLSADELVG